VQKVASTALKIICEQKENLDKKKKSTLHDNKTTTLRQHGTARIFITKNKKKKKN
jgi:hypothetical protein